MPRVTITIPEKTPQPYRFDLQREVVTVGRGLDNDIVVGCGSVSGKHSEMHRVKGGYKLIDVGSTNGIKIDGIRQQTVVLYTGMTVKLGDVEFGFTLNEEELAVLAAESEPTASPVVKEEEDSKKEEETKKEEISEKSVSKEVESKKDDPKKDESKKVDPKKDEEDEDDGPDKLPELPPVRLDKRKEKEDQEAEKRRKELRKEREKREASEAKEEKSARREKRERPASSENSDEYGESKAVTIGSGFILFTLIAAAAAFFYGASTRHEKDTGEKLLKSIVNKEDVKKDAPTEVEDKAE